MVGTDSDLYEICCIFEYELIQSAVRMMPEVNFFQIHQTTRQKKALLLRAGLLLSLLDD